MITPRHILIAAAAMPASHSSAVAPDVSQPGPLRPTDPFDALDRLNQQAFDNRSVWQVIGIDVL